MTIATIAHRQIRFSAGTDPRAQAQAQTEAQPASDPKVATKPSMPKFSAAEGIARAAVRAYTACRTFFKDLTMKAFSLIAHRSDARAPRATAGVFNAQRAAANPVQGESMPLLSRAPEMGAVKLRGDADTVILSRTPEMGGVKWRDNWAAAATSRVSTRMASTASYDSASAASVRASHASIATESGHAEAPVAAPAASAIHGGAETAAPAAPAKIMVSMETQTDAVDLPTLVKRSGSTDSQAFSDSGVESGGDSPASPAATSIGAAFSAVRDASDGKPVAARAAVQGVPPAPPAPTVEMLRAEKKDPLAALRAKREAGRGDAAVSDGAPVTVAKKATPKDAARDLAAAVMESPLFKAQRKALEEAALAATAK